MDDLAHLDPMTADAVREIRHRQSPHALDAWTWHDVYDQRPKPREWIVEGWIPDRNVTMFSGDGAAGKSTVALQLAVACVTGRQWLGKDVKHGPVLYIGAEDDEEELHRRVDAIVQAEGLEYSDLRGLATISLAGKDAILYGPTDPKAGKGVGPTDLFLFGVWGEIAFRKPALVIIDPLADVFGGDENSKPQTRGFISALRGLAMEQTTSVLLISHPSMTGMASGSGTSGNVAWNNSVRSRIYMTRPRDQESKDTLDHDARLIEVMKANFAPSGVKIAVRWQAGVFVSDSAPLSTKTGAALAEEARFTFLDLLAQFTREGRSVSHQPSPTYAPKLFAAHARGAGFGKPMFVRAMDRLLADGRIRIETFGPPSKPRSRLVEITANAMQEAAE